jgi:CheY-like chemotaxis protein
MAEQRHWHAIVTRRGERSVTDGSAPTAHDISWAHIIPKGESNMMASSKPPSVPTVLVVEDDPMLRMLTASELQDAGFDILEAEDADEAIEILETRADIRVVYTDIEMPGSMDGLKLASMVRDRWPPVEIIVTSGKRLPDADQLPQRSRFFPKPTDPSVIAKTIREFCLTTGGT